MVSQTTGLAGKVVAFEVSGEYQRTRQGGQGAVRGGVGLRGHRRRGWEQTALVQAVRDDQVDFGAVGVEEADLGIEAFVVRLADFDEGDGVGGALRGGSNPMRVRGRGLGAQSGLSTGGCVTRRGGREVCEKGGGGSIPLIWGWSKAGKVQRGFRRMRRGARGRRVTPGEPGAICGGYMRGGYVEAGVLRYRVKAQVIGGWVMEPGRPGQTVKGGRCRGRGGRWGGSCGGS